MKALKNIRLKRQILGGIFFICVFTLIAFVERRHDGKKIEKIEVRVDYLVDNYFVDEEGILELITNDGRRRLIGETYDQVDLKEIERIVKTHKFVKEAQVFRDYNGKLVVQVTQKKPVARMIRNDGPHGYIDESGEVLPVSEKFTARVLLVDGPFLDSLFVPGYFKTEPGKKYLELFRALDQDKLWKSQLVQGSVNQYGEITFAPQIGNQKILFGKPEDAVIKLKKLKIFYKEILPAKGWNNYLTVNLKYKNQVICE